MSKKDEIIFEGFLKKCLESALKQVVNKVHEETVKEEDETLTKKFIFLGEKDIENFNTLVSFVVDLTTSEARLLVNQKELENYNKEIKEVLLDNIEASLELLKEVV